MRPTHRRMPSAHSPKRIDTIAYDITVHRGPVLVVPTPPKPPQPAAPPLDPPDELSATHPSGHTKHRPSCTQAAQPLVCDSTGSPCRANPDTRATGSKMVKTVVIDSMCFQCATDGDCFCDRSSLSTLHTLPLKPHTHIAPLA